MTTRKPIHRMHPTQAAYFAARALSEQAEASAEAAIKAHLPHADNETEEQWEAIEDAADATRENYRVHDLRRALRAAERTMLDWSIGCAKKIATPAQQDEIDAMRAKLELHPALWRRAIESASRLAA